MMSDDITQRQSTENDDFDRRWATMSRDGVREPMIRVIQLPPASIADLTAHIEASDGIGLVRTLDEERGYIECWIMPDFEEAFDVVLEGLKRYGPIQDLGKEFE